MALPEVRFDEVWKKFRRGEHHDSLRDLIPSMLRRGLAGRRSPDELRPNDFWVLEDVSFRVRPGEALGIIGPNGAGKSTTLKLLSRILRPTKGVVDVRGRIGALIELAAGFHPDLTGRENVFLQGAIMGLKQAEIRERFDDIVAFSGVEEFLDTPVKRYSSGMNARLGFSIAAHLDPDVLLIDEVLAVGDLRFQRRCHDRLQAIREAGVPLVFVSHNLQAVSSLCDRALLLRRGCPPLLGPTSEVIQEYARGSLTSTDPRVEILEVELLRDVSGTTLQEPISPGEWLELGIGIRALESLGRCGVSLAVWRADGLRVFDGIVTGDDELIDLASGAELRGTIRFRANLLKGVYSVGIVVFDEERRNPHIRLQGLASFTVDERSRAAGFAELDPAADFAVTR